MSILKIGNSFRKKLAISKVNAADFRDVKIQEGNGTYNKNASDRIPGNIQKESGRDDR